MTSIRRPVRVKAETRTEAPLDSVFAFVADVRKPVLDRRSLPRGGRSWLQRQADQALTELDHVMASYSAGAAGRFRRLGRGRLPQG